MKYLSVAFLSLLITLTGCRWSTTGQAQQDDEFVVSILPLKFLTEYITGNDFPVVVLVPPGASPETYEPTPQQIIKAEKARAVFTTGLIDFENALTASIKGNTGDKFYTLYNGIELISGSCGHVHNHEGIAHKHASGIDPHIWTSPKELKVMSGNLYKAIALLYPDSTKYITNYKELVSKLDALDQDISEKIRQSEVSSFIIYHPALTYYSRHYGLEQISLEHDGKEPSAARLKNIIARAKAEGVKSVFYQSQFSESTVRTVAGDIGATAVEIDPMREDVINNLREITDLITGR